MAIVDNTVVANASEVAVNDQASAAQYNNLLEDALSARVRDIYRGGNLVKNFPQYDSWKTAANINWWAVSTDGSLATYYRSGGFTDSGAPLSINDEGFELTLSPGGVSMYGDLSQEFVHTDEPLLLDSDTVVSGGVWVYLESGIDSATLQIKNGAGTVIGSSATSVTGSWVYLEVKNVTVGTTKTTFAIVAVSASASAVSVAITNPVFNVGPTPIPFEPRRKRYVALGTPVELLADGSLAGWTDIDVTTNTHALAFAADIMIHVRYNAATSNFAVRPNGSAWTVAAAKKITIVSATESAEISTIIPLDSGQVFEYTVDLASLQNAVIYLQGYERWI